MDITSDENKAVATISASLLVAGLKMSSGAGNADELLIPMMQKKYKRSFSSFIFVHDALHPVEIFEALRDYLQPSASFAIYSTYLQPLSQLLEKMNTSKHRDVVNARIEELLTREM